MLTSIASLLGSAALGAIIKIVAGFVLSWIQAKQREKEFQFRKDLAFAKIRQENARLFEAGEERASTVWTRRILGWSMCWTLCFIAVLWSIYPNVQLVRYIPSSDIKFSIIWGLVSWSIPGGTTIVVTTGSIVHDLLNLFALVITAYFTPGGGNK